VDGSIEEQLRRLLATLMESAPELSELVEGGEPVPLADPEGLLAAVRRMRRGESLMLRRPGGRKGPQDFVVIAHEPGAPGAGALRMTIDEQEGLAVSCTVNLNTGEVSSFEQLRRSFVSKSTR
jgi:hypothetical protein